MKYTWSSSSVKFSPSSLATLLILFNVMLPVSSSSNNLKAFNISSFSSFSLFKNKNNWMSLVFHLFLLSSWGVERQCAVSWALTLLTALTSKIMPVHSHLPSRYSNSGFSKRERHRVVKRVYFVLTPANETHYKDEAPREQGRCLSGAWPKQALNQ